MPETFPVSGLVNRHIAWLEDKTGAGAAIGVCSTSWATDLVLGFNRVCYRSAGVTDPTGLPEVPLPHPPAVS